MQTAGTDVTQVVRYGPGEANLVRTAKNLKKSEALVGSSCSMQKRAEPCLEQLSKRARQAMTNSVLVFQDASNEASCMA